MIAPTYLVPGRVYMVRYNDTTTWVPAIATTPIGHVRTQEHGSVHHTEFDGIRPAFAGALTPDSNVSHERAAKFIQEILDKWGKPHPDNLSAHYGGTEILKAILDAFQPLLTDDDDPARIGAVVRDVDDQVWVCIIAPPSPSPSVWYNAAASPTVTRLWRDLRVRRTPPLAPGVEL